MNCMMDASAIFFCAKNSRTRSLVDMPTLSLARYEAGNALWKDYHLHRKIDANTAASLSSILESAFDLLTIHEIEKRTGEILGVAAKLGISFYDASYVCMAKAMDMPLVTTDGRLKRKVGTYIPILTPEEFLQDSLSFSG